MPLPLFRGSEGFVKILPACISAEIAPVQVQSKGIVAYAMVRTERTRGMKGGGDFDLVSKVIGDLRTIKSLTASSSGFGGLYSIRTEPSAFGLQYSLDHTGTSILRK
ncbi:hypothetical protein WG66_003260 [Moniliophthora roreri]|nr:hypothetical protein WG66_003260 [Moniliophthora roreri]